MSPSPEPEAQPSQLHPTALTSPPPGRTGDGPQTNGPVSAVRPGETPPWIAASSLPRGHGQIERYQMEGEIDRGGMGVVLRARDADFNRPLAVKVLLAKGCLAPDREARPRHAGALAEAVVAYQAGVQERLRQAELGRAQAEEALKKATPHDGRALYAAACVWGLASGAAAKTGNADDTRRANEYADRAAALLADALDKGFHDLFYPEHNRMDEDPALAAVRQHPRVRALLSRKP